MPVGKSPVVLTFDDSTIFQLELGPDGEPKHGTAVAILRSSPASRLRAEGDVLPAPRALRWHGALPSTSAGSPRTGSSSGTTRTTTRPCASQRRRGSAAARRRRPGDPRRGSGLPDQDAGVAARLDAQAFGAGSPRPLRADLRAVRRVPRRGESGAVSLLSGLRPDRDPADPQLAHAVVVGGGVHVRVLDARARPNPEQRFVSDGDPRTITVRRADRDSLAQRFRSRVRVRLAPGGLLDRRAIAGGSHQSRLAAYHSTVSRRPSSQPTSGSQPSSRRSFEESGGRRSCQAVEDDRLQRVGLAVCSRTRSAISSIDASMLTRRCRSRRPCPTRARARSPGSDPGRGATRACSASMRTSAAACRRARW